MGLGDILAEMQIACAGNAVLVLMDAVVAMKVTMAVIVAVVMVSGVVVVMMPVTVMMMVAIMMVTAMQVGVVAVPRFTFAFAINANVLRPAAAYLAHGYLPILVVEGLLAEGSPA